VAICTNVVDVVGIVVVVELAAVEVSGTLEEVALVGVNDRLVVGTELEGTEGKVVIKIVDDLIVDKVVVVENDLAIKVEETFFVEVWKTVALIVVEAVET